MIALMGMLRIVPAWVYALIAFVALAGAGAVYEREKGKSEGRAIVQALWDADKLARANAEKSAVLERVAQNQQIFRQQEIRNQNITKANNDELAQVRAALAAAKRVRQPAFCSGSASPAEAASAGGSDATDPASRLLPESVDSAIRALILETEQAAATGRVCQAFVKANGMAQ